MERKLKRHEEVEQAIKKELIEFIFMLALVRCGCVPCPPPANLYFLLYGSLHLFEIHAPTLLHLCQPTMEPSGIHLAPIPPRQWDESQGKSLSSEDFTRTLREKKPIEV